MSVYITMRSRGVGIGVCVLQVCLAEAGVYGSRNACES